MSPSTRLVAAALLLSGCVIPAPSGLVDLSALDPAGAIAAELPVEKAGDHAVLRLEHQPSLWFLLRR